MTKSAYSVEFDPRAWDEIMAQSDKMQRRIFAATDSLETAPRSSGAKKMKGAVDLYRVRVGSFRILYRVRDNELLVIVVKVGNRKTVYRKH